MPIEDAIQSRSVLFSSAGKAAASALFPRDFELYFTALELVDSSGRTIDYFAFPINPNNITETHPQITNIKKTNAGITTLSNTTFIPRQINISGNFGRRFKVLLGRDSFSLSGFSTGRKALQVVDFNPTIKTGYGCIKVLEKIVERARELDDRNNPTSLYFYNLSLGNSYLVKIVNATFSQNQENNMIWQYNLSLSAVAPLSQIQTGERKKSLTSTLTSAVLQKQAANLANSLLKSII